jgi:hypothetical protein
MPLGLEITVSFNMQIRTIEENHADAIWGNMYVTFFLQPLAIGVYVTIVFLSMKYFYGF